MFWLAIDLSELVELDAHVAGFGYNRRSLASIWDGDYGGPSPGPIAEKVSTLLRRGGFDEVPHRVTLLTIPRIAGYVFNPVNFYVCVDEYDEIAVIIAEVRNTFGEMHHYVAAPDPASSSDETKVFRLPKLFYVSPFLEVEGEYCLTLQRLGERLDITIDLRRDDELVFSASMFGRGRPISSRSLLSTIAQFPLFAALIMLRIKWQAVQLFFRRRLRTHEKPHQLDPDSLKLQRSSVWYQLRALVVRWARGRRRQSPQNYSSRLEGLQE